MEQGPKENDEIVDIKFSEYLNQFLLEVFQGNYNNFRRFLRQYNVTHLNFIGLSERLSLRITEIDFFKKLGEALQGTPVISVDLRRNDFSPKKSVCAFTAGLTADTSVIELDLSNNPIGAKEVLDCIKNLKGKPVKVISFRDISFDKALMKKIAEALKDTSIESIDFSRNTRFDSKDLIKFATKLAQTKIKRLDLSRTNMSAETAIKLIKAFKDSENEKLTTLDISGNVFGADVVGIFNELNGCPIAALCLKNARINSADAKNLAPFLKKNKHLKKLDLGGNAIGDEGIEHIAQVLGNTPIAILGLADIDLTLKGIQALVEGLKRAPFVKTLDLSRIGFTPKMLGCLMAGSKKNSVTAIDLSDINFTDEMLELLGELLADAKITKIKLTKDRFRFSQPPEPPQRITDDGLIKFARCLQGTPVVFVDLTGVEVNDKDKVATAFSDCIPRSCLQTLCLGFKNTSVSDAIKENRRVFSSMYEVIRWNPFLLSEDNIEFLEPLSESEKNDSLAQMGEAKKVILKLPPELQEHVILSFLPKMKARSLNLNPYLNIARESQNKARGLAAEEEPAQAMRLAEEEELAQVIKLAEDKGRKKPENNRKKGKGRKKEKKEEEKEKEKEKDKDKEKEKEGEKEKEKEPNSKKTGYKKPKGK